MEVSDFSIDVRYSPFPRKQTLTVAAYPPCESCHCIRPNKPSLNHLIDSRPNPGRVPMINQRPFGRRSNPQPQTLRVRQKFDSSVPATNPTVLDVSADQSVLLHKETIFPHPDKQPWEWERPETSRYKLPWRQLSLMASLCFGIASFVLPDSINDELDWLLYGLMAMSMYVGLSKRFIKS